VILGSLLLAVTVFTPPILVSAAPPSLPGPNVVAGGEVLIEATVDISGAVVRPIVLRTTLPFTNMVLDAISRWRFTPAHAPDPEGRDRVITSQILIGAAYRPPQLGNGPTLGTRPADVASASPSSPYPVTTAVPAQPLQAVSPGMVLMELSLNESGATSAVRTVGGDTSFESAARDALTGWRFRGATVDGRPVPSKAYVAMGFPLPVVVIPPDQQPSDQPPK
jgi:hypothetical protein